MALKTAKGKRRLAQYKRRAATGSMFTNKQKSGIYRKSLISNPPSKKGAQTMYNQLWGSAHQIVPDRFRTKVSASFQGYIGAGTTATATYDLPLNNLPIPFNGTFNDVTLADAGSATFATIEPQGWRTICNASAAYQSYRVTGCKVRMVYQPGSIPDTAQIVFVPFVSGDDQCSNSMQAAAEPHSQTRTVNSNNMLSDNIIEKYFKLHEIFGVKKQAIMMEDDYKALYNANPAQRAFLNIFRANLNNAALNSNAFIQVQVTWYVQFENPQTAFANT